MAKYKCSYCDKLYIRKSSLKNHQILCEYRTKTDLEKKVEDEEEEDVPSQRELYKLVCQLTNEVNILKKNMNEMQTFIKSKKQKINIFDWLQKYIKPIINYDEWVSSYIKIDYTYEVMLLEKPLNEVIKKLLENNLSDKHDNVFPIICFIQKPHSFYIYNDKWKMIDEKEIKQLLSYLSRILLKTITNWKNNNQEKMNTNNNLYNAYHKCISKIMDIGLNNITSIQKSIRQSLFDTLKIDLHKNMEYEIELNS